MSSHNKRICKVYIHDLDVKSEVRVRQKILMCGAGHATHVRFDGDVNNADIWILNEGSAFKAIAQKRQKVSKFALWISQNSDLYASDGIRNSILNSENLAHVIDSIVTGRKISINQASPPKPSQKPTSKVARSIKEGVDNRKGLLCLKHSQAQLLFDFSNATVHYNAEGHSLLWDDVVVGSCLHDFEITETPPSAETLSFNCSMFSAIWQLCHRDTDGSLIEPLDRNSVLELKSWPTFELVEHEYDHCRIASFLQKRSLSVEQVIKLMKLENDLVNRFYNAIYLSSYANFDQVSAGFDAVVTDRPSKNTLAGLWRKVRGAIQI